MLLSSRWVSLLQNVTDEDCELLLNDNTGAPTKQSNDLIIDWLQALFTVAFKSKLPFDCSTFTTTWLLVTLTILATFAYFKYKKFLKN